MYPGWPADGAKDRGIAGENGGGRWKGLTGEAKFNTKRLAACLVNTSNGKNLNGKG